MRGIRGTSPINPVGRRRPRRIGRLVDQHVPAALKVNPSTPTRLAPAKLISNPVYAVLSIGLVIPAGRTIANFTAPPVTLKPTAPAVLTVSSAALLGVPLSFNSHPSRQTGSGCSDLPSSPPLRSTSRWPRSDYCPSSLLVPWVIVKLAVPTTKPNAFKLTLPPTCNATPLVNSLLNIGRICAVSVAVAQSIR